MHRNRNSCAIASAFTLIELLVVIAIIAILAAIMAPAVTKAKARTQSFTCLNNLRQLQTGWHLYLTDHDDNLVPNKDGNRGDDNWASFSGSWVVGTAEFDTATSNIQSGVLYSYHPSTDIYRCPADKTKLKDDSGLLTTRSYQLSGWLNGPNDLLTAVPPVREKFSSLKNPVRIFGFLDSKTCDSGSFYIAPYGYEWGEFETMWINSPGDWHNRGGNLSFLDGRVEHHRWRWSKTNIFHFVPTEADDIADLRWMQDLIPKE